MAYSKGWVETDPDGAVITVSQLDNAIRDVKIAMRERLEAGGGAGTLAGIFDNGTFGTAPVTAKGTGRFYADLENNIGSFTKLDGRGYFTTDSNATSHPKIYSMEGAGQREIAYLNRDGSRPMLGDLTISSPNNLIISGRIVTDLNGNVSIGAGGLTSGATNGFIYIPTINGAPTGVPNAFAGFYAMAFDITNNKLWVYHSGVGWKSVSLT